MPVHLTGATAAVTLTTMNLYHLMWQAIESRDFNEMVQIAVNISFSIAKAAAEIKAAKWRWTETTRALCKNCGDTKLIEQFRAKQLLSHSSGASPYQVYEDHREVVL